jgi:hypothetical protein
MSERKDGYVQALRDLKTYHEEKLRLREVRDEMQAHHDAIEFIDNLLIAKGRPINAAEEDRIADGGSGTSIGGG